MFEFTGSISDFSLDYKSGKAKIEFTVNEKADAMLFFDELHEVETLDIKVGKYRKKRSLDANAYFWVLCGKLAAATGQPKTEIYRELIREIGNNFEVLPIRSDAVEAFIDCWEHGRLGWICEILSESKLKGYTNVIAYYGSSVYDSKQMSDLINLVVFECQEQGIQTATPEEIANMISLWKEEKG